MAYTTLNDVRTVERIVKDQKALDATKNKSMHSLVDRKLEAKEYYGRNFSFCDFERTNISGCIFRRCNFSFAINLNKAITDGKTAFIESNLTAADLPIIQTEKCNTARKTDKDIEEMYKDTII